MNSHALRVAGLGLLLLTGACAGPEKPLEDAAPNLRRDPRSAVEMTPTGDSELTARAALVDVAREFWYVDGASGPARMTQTRHDPAAFGRWDIVQTVEGGVTPGESIHEHTWVGDSVTMARSHDGHEKVITDFQPPMVVMPATLRRREPHLQRFRMVVRPVAHPDRVQTQGDATHEITFIGSEVVTVPAGRFEAARVRSVLRASLGAARVENTTEAWHARGIGVVATRQTQRVTALGLTVRNSDEVWVLERFAR